MYKHKPILKSEPMAEIPTKRESYINTAPVQRALMKGKESVSYGEFIANLNIVRRAGGINPHNLAIDNMFAQYVYQFFNIIKGRENIAIGTALRGYWRAMTEGHDYLQSSAVSQAALELAYTGSENQQRLSEILSGSSGALTLIFRGTNSNQAKKILANQTLGGEVSAGQDLPSPGEAAAKAQTGLNIKETEEGRIEEWSTKFGGLTGFATDGVMLVALVNRDSIATSELSIGEQGATGYAKQPLVSVAIYEIGRKSEIPDNVKFFDTVKKSFNLAHGGQDKTQAKPHVAKPVANFDPSDKFFD
ncbi:hypothetical protein [Pseudoalteromonas aurantia]|uniref:Penicillin-binding protein transpeptidase domain-containing protein n=1 Tax=Pseudoalteromonas aurantia 208 TaxID=1314867 RepID=A0ABR9EJ84_9GAMM|nr:hypothetical protein [Pseudoalteromonas aurantia]MBE0370310.1 hypothetical protein [Pseudoalteromonas aurantia 208]